MAVGNMGSGPWSIFSGPNGNQNAVAWAEQFLAQAGLPVNQGNVQFVYDWEKSEGGGGLNNPLNQGPVPHHPELTTTGSQYGGGAAAFASIAAGIQGAVDYINMPAYSQVKANLAASNPAGARAALIASPWAASHYGGGSAFSSAPLPGGTNTATLTDFNIGDIGKAAGAAVTGGGSILYGSTVGGAVSSAAGSVASGVWGAVEPFLVRAGLFIVGAILVIIALVIAAHNSDPDAQPVPIPVPV